MSPSEPRSFERLRPTFVQPLQPGLPGRSLLLSASALLLLALCAARPALAQGTHGTSSAFGSSASLRLVTFLGQGLTVQLEPTAELSGSAPPSYHQDNVEGSAKVSLPLLGEILSSNQVATLVSGSVASAPALFGQAEVHDTEMGLGVLVPLLTLSAGHVEVQASVAGPCGGALAAEGSTSIQDGTIGGALGLGLALPTNPPPDTVLINRNGVRLVVNERFLSGSGFGDLRLQVNGIHLYLNQAVVTGIGVLSGDLVIGHAEARLVCGDDL